MKGNDNDCNAADPEVSQLVIPPELERALHAHQISALHFMWRKLVDNGIERVIRQSRGAPLTDRVRLYQEVFGCIVGHSMGLGKTITALSFLLLLQKHYATSDNVSSKHKVTDSSEASEDEDTAGAPVTASCIRVLVLTPRSCTYHWQSSAEQWMSSSLFGGTQLPLYVPLGNSATDALVLKHYHEGGALLLGYEEYNKLVSRAREVAGGGQSYSRVHSIFDRSRPPLPLTRQVVMSEMLESFDVVVFDESHRFKRPKSRLVTALKQSLHAVQLRIALTGTPLQNHLEEYGVMHSVVTGGAFDLAPFRRLFAIPIERGQCADSTYEQYLEMQKCVASLRRFFSTTVHPCGPEVLKRDLPERREYLILVGLSPQQEDAYRSLLRQFFPDMNKGVILNLHHKASHICCHAMMDNQLVQVLCQSVYVDENGRETHSNLGAGRGVQTPGKDSVTDDCDSESRESSRDESEFSGDISSSSSSTSSSASDLKGQSQANTSKENASVDIWLKRLRIDESPKLNLTLSLLRYISEDLREKVVLFSTYKSHLYLLMFLLRQRGVVSEVLHGGVEVKERQLIIDRFSVDPSLRVLLCSTKALGVGINLVAANHCILFDVSWNPSDDTQATYRLYRYGQRRPVTIYRIATEGTFEHVVFFYALSKSWIHKKIVDVSDPARYDRHVKENYFIYPCPLPVDFEQVDGKPEVRTKLPNGEALQKKWRDYASLHCPSLLHTARDGTFAWIRAITEYSFLVRDSTEEAIREMGLRFEAERRKPLMPVVIEKVMGGSRPVQEKTGNTMQRCEPSLQVCLSGCADQLVSMASQGQAHHEEVQRHVADVSKQEMEKRLTCLLAKVLGVPEPAGGLVEVVTLIFHLGVDHVMQETLNKAPYAKLRSVLNARVLNSKLSEKSLQNSLKFKPFTLFAIMAPTEVTYTLTELGFNRPFAPHCTLVGVRCALRSNNISRDTLQELYNLLASASADVNIGTGDAVTAADVEAVMLKCMESYWPPYAGMALPAPTKGAEQRRSLAERALRVAGEHTTGFVLPREAARYVGISPLTDRCDVYQCQRCNDGLMERMLPEYVLKCGRCHYNAEFDLQSQPETHHACAVYQFSVVCGLLDAFSHFESLKKAFVPLECRGVLHALRRLRQLSKVYTPKEFISSVLRFGVESFLQELPEPTLGLLRLQCGAKDVDTLKDILLSDSSFALSNCVHTHVRQMLINWLKSNTVASSGMHIVTMPEALIILALQLLGKRYKGENGFAKDVLSEAQSGNLCGNAALLRFVCDAVVKLKYIERLLERPLTRATLDAFMMDYATPSGGSSESEGSKPDEQLNGQEKSDDEESKVDEEDEEMHSLSTNSASSPSFRPDSRKRQRSPSLCMSEATVLSTVQSSSYSSCYPGGESLETSVSEDRAESVAYEAMEEGDIQMVRSAHFWASHCEVYGISSTETHTIQIDGEGCTANVLHPPPNSFWAREVHGATHDGMRISSVIDLFLEKLFVLSASVRVIK
ncbi:SNF2 DNA repair protein, putative [Trypanosoma brucei brucei TREU927]|uniref:SNF2 DNA repair protein, putative n=1 Tax=Trypanosoma brucei brucei (strain 927/4 GUTat10.1) TaxID=185431 RepID=Q580T1_TRYB2|nr:SNF2 DNA repair protein, putative [Trypanosoma brucei brucei TREU927]AAX81053.1 SNF2 DNA repair protein, putative [Trypanosoma brucei]AAZ10575.1 SNF2 DNA repair protein, putative [Trypanosoma brucei brucei TREU927]